MGRRKIEIKAIKDDRNRSVTFLKRKGGLFKKAHELSVLCSVDVTVIIFGHNKKLYEFSSADIQETLGRYQYYGQPHEHKGPADFLGKGALDDDEDDDSPAPEDQMPHHAFQQQQQQQQQKQYIKQQLPQHPHVKQPPPSVSPPIDAPHAPPPGQGQAPSRPSSRNHVQRMAMHHHQQQQHHHHGTPPPPPQPSANAQNGFTYIQGYQQHHPQQHQQQQQHQQPYYSHQPLPPPQHQPMAQQYMQDRRQSMPPAFQEQHHQPHQQQQQQIKVDRSPPPQPKPMPTKSRSIFTPIDDRGSVLAQHFGFGESPKKETKPRQPPPPQPQPQQQQQQHHQHRTHSVSSIPSRTNSIQSNIKRPVLKVQIPSETSDAGSITAGSSPATGTNPATAAAAATSKPPAETGHSTVVLPPPSPSASAFLSAGAHGPPNPFARPPPPPTSSSQNANNGSTSNNNIDTPISALPSRFVSDTLLPSPSSFYPEWGFGRSGPDSNMLPSPLTFSTPVLQNHSQPFTSASTSNSVANRDADEADRKRKEPESSTEAAVDKRLKVE
ncbi:resistance to lethality of mkk1p386 overexpression [Microsporum canis]